MAWVNLNTIYATKSEVNSKVPNTRTINGKALSSNVTLGASDIKLSDDTTLQSAWDSISRSRVLYKSIVLNGSGWKLVLSSDDIANYFGIESSDVESKIVPVVSNGDIDANSCDVLGLIDSYGFSVKGITNGMYRVNAYLIMP